MCLMLTACQFNLTRKNRRIDKEAAEQITNRLFLSLERKNYNAADTLFSKSFYKDWSKKKLNGIFETTVDQLGEIQDIDLVDCQTSVVTGTNSSSEYAFLYKVRYQYYSGLVTIHLIKDPDGEIRVDDYSVKSDGLDNK